MRKSRTIPCIRRLLPVRLRPENWLLDRTPTCMTRPRQPHISGRLAEHRETRGCGSAGPRPDRSVLYGSAHRTTTFVHAGLSFALAVRCSFGRRARGRSARTAGGMAWVPARSPRPGTRGAPPLAFELCAETGWLHGQQRQRLADDRSSRCRSRQAARSRRCAARSSRERVGEVVDGRSLTAPARPTSRRTLGAPQVVWRSCTVVVTGALHDLSRRNGAPSVE
jgi:hypothetical protein